MHDMTATGSSDGLYMLHGQRKECVPAHRDTEELWMNRSARTWTGDTIRGDVPHMLPPLQLQNLADE